MSRAVIALDRFAVFLLGLFALAFGIATILWWSGNLNGLSDPINANALSGLDQKTSWRWITGGSGIVLVILGLRWLLAHIDRRGIDQLSVKSPAAKGRISFDTSAVADAAARKFEASPGVDSAKARIIRDRGQNVFELDSTIEQSADLALIGRAADSLAEELRTTLARNDIFCRINLEVARRKHALPRVN